MVVPRSGVVHYSACFDANAGLLFSQVVAPGSSWLLETLERFLLPMVKLRSWLNPTSPVSPSLLMHYFPCIPPRAGGGQFLLSVGSDVGCCLGAHQELPGRRGVRYGWAGYGPGLSTEEVLGPCSKPFSVPPFIRSFQICDTQIRLPGAHRFWVMPKFLRTPISSALGLVSSPRYCPMDSWSSALAVFLV